MAKSPEEMQALQDRVNGIATEVWTSLGTATKHHPQEGPEAFLHAAGAGQGGLLFAAEMALRTKMNRAAFVDLAGKIFDQVRAHAAG